MHERYTYPLDILLVMLACINSKYLVYAIVSVVLSIYTYGNYLFHTSAVNRTYAIFCLIAWALYMNTIIKSDGKAPLDEMILKI